MIEELMDSAPVPDFGNLLGDAPSGLPNMLAPAPKSEPIDRLRPKSDLHNTVLQKLKERLEFSERAMSELYPRWNYNEQALQAYIRLDRNQQRLKDFNIDGRAPQVVDIVVPYAYASQEAIVTYISSVLFAGRPLFQLEAISGTKVETAQMMEHVLQYNADHSRLIRQGFQLVWDAATYGLGHIFCPYVNEFGYRTRVHSAMGQIERVRQEVLSYSGNKPRAIDPYRFFPDPRVPFSRAHTEGDFMFWRDFSSKLEVRKREQEGIYKHTDALSDNLPRSEVIVESQRNRRVGVPNQTPRDSGREASIERYVQLDQGVVKLIPSEWGLGDSKKVERWLFTIGNKMQILQAMPLEMDHDMMPGLSTEPWSFGYEFGGLSAADFLIPFQEALSWLFNSRMHNVRTSVNNMFIVDPSRIELQDIERSGPGKVIRLSKAFYGSDIRMAISQLPVTDVTQSHMGDMQVLQRIADQTLGVNDNLRGMMHAGGRKSATESRISMEAGASRMAHAARLISSECTSVLAQQMAMNVQQYMPDEMWVNIVGSDGQAKQQLVTPEMINGDFNYRVSDGSLPFDKSALTEVWKEILLGVAQDPELRQTFSLVSIFEYIAELSGARNIERFKQSAAPPPVAMNVESQSPEAIQQDVDQGNLLPIDIAGAFR